MNVKIITNILFYLINIHSNQCNVFVKLRSFSYRKMSCKIDIRLISILLLTLCEWVLMYGDSEMIRLYLLSDLWSIVVFDIRTNGIFQLSVGLDLFGWSCWTLNGICAGRPLWKNIVLFLQLFHLPFFFFNENTRFRYMNFRIGNYFECAVQVWNSSHIYFENTWLINGGILLGLLKIPQMWNENN